MKHGRSPQVPRQNEVFEFDRIQAFCANHLKPHDFSYGAKQSQTAINHEHAKPEKQEKLNCVTKLKTLENYLPITIDYVWFGGNNAVVELLAAMNSTRNLILLTGKDV